MRINKDTVFPAYAGMSLAMSFAHVESDCFPRLRGDEPVAKGVPLPKDSFSPPTRG